jgi:signal transduction histidine kinase/ActR/RegA family two-component response regulator
MVAEHAKTLHSGRSDSFEVRIVTKDKRVRWIRVSERPVIVNEKVERIYGAAQDITLQKQLEEQLLQSRKMEAIGQLAGGVAHDFNNLLTVICGYGDLLQRQPDLNATVREYADEILEAANRAAQVTRQLLAFGRRQIFRAKTVNLNNIVAGLDKLLRSLIGENVELRTVYDRDLGLVKVDPGQIDQVLMNLAVNARDAMPKGGRLTIETANVDTGGKHAGPLPKGGPCVMLTVSDTGSGMDPETAARAFEPFFTTKEPGKGTGLGLAMVYGIVSQSGGDIRLDTSPGLGTTFKIYLPRLVEAVEDDVEPAPFNLRMIRGTETILVLEDENALRALIREVLRKAGHTVLDTGDPDEAIRLCERHSGEIALFITDVVMPKLSGPEVVERVSTMRPGMRIIYTSGYPGKAAIPNLLRPTGSPFLEKPFTPDALVRKVRAVLDGPDTDRPDTDRPDTDRPDTDRPDMDEPDSALVL